MMYEVTLLELELVREHDTVTLSYQGHELSGEVWVDAQMHRRAGSLDLDEPGSVYAFVKGVRLVPPRFFVTCLAELYRLEGEAVSLWVPLANEWRRQPLGESELAEHAREITVQSGVFEEWLAASAAED